MGLVMGTGTGMAMAMAMAMGKTYDMGATTRNGPLILLHSIKYAINDSVWIVFPNP